VVRREVARSFAVLVWSAQFRANTLWIGTPLCAFCPLAGLV
jgi:hypothetical protein